MHKKVRIPLRGNVCKRKVNVVFSQPLLRRPFCESRNFDLPSAAVFPTLVALELYSSLKCLINCNVLKFDFVNNTSKYIFKNFV